MQSDNHTFLQVLRIQDCELWNSKGNEMALDFHGDLQVIYSSSLDQFILRIQNLRTTLDKSVEVISSVVGRHQRQAFFLASREGFSMIRLSDSKQTPVLQNFETILESTTSFSRKTGLNPILASFKEIQESGLKESIMKTFDAFSKVLIPSAENESHPNQKMTRSFDELKDLDTTGTPMVDVSQSELDDLKEKLEKDNTTYQNNGVWKRFTSGEVEDMSRTSGASEMSGEQQDKHHGHQKTSDIEQLAPKSEERSTESSKGDQKFEACRYHPSIDHQEVVGAQQQRLPSYEVNNTQEHKAHGFRKASANLQQGPSDATELPEPENFDDEAFTTGLLTKNHKEVSNIGTDKEFPVSSEDAFKDLTHPMRKFSYVDRPFLNIDEDTEYVKTDKVKEEGSRPKGNFVAQPILTSKGQPTLKSNIDEQPSPISNTEKYTKESSQPESSDFEKVTEGTSKDLEIPFSSTEAHPIKPSNTVGQQNIVRESSQGNETKKQKKISNAPVDKENLRSTTAI